MTQRARGFFEQYFRRLCRERDLSVIDQLRAPDAGTKGLTSDRSYRAFVARTFEVFDDTEVVIDRVVEQGDEAALFLRFRARTKDGRSIEARGSGYVRFEGGKIAEAENLWDLLGLFASLGEPLEGLTTFSDVVESVAKRCRGST